MNLYAASNKIEEKLRQKQISSFLICPRLARTESEHALAMYVVTNRLPSTNISDLSVLHSNKSVFLIDPILWFRAPPSN